LKSGSRRNVSSFISNWLIRSSARIIFDDRGNPEIKLSDISPLLLKDYLVKVGSRLQNEDLVNDLEGVLEQMDLLEGPTEKWCIKNVAAMMFCEHPEKFFKTTQVDIVIFPEGRENNPDNIIELPTIKGSVPMMIRDAMSYLRTNVIKEQIKKQFDDEHSIRYFNYPYQALEEAVVNALYHRNYNEREPVEITVEPNRISILNHGGPDRSIPLDVVRKAQTLRCRKYRNRRLGEFLKEMELTEGRATGIPTIQRKLKDNGSASAIFETDEDRAYFLIDIPCHPDFVEEDLSNVVSYVDILDNKQLKQALSNVVSNVMSNIVGANFEHIFKVFGALQNETSLTELMTMFRQTNRDRFKRTSVDILIQTGLATPTILNKPKSSNQKYVLTEAGRKLIKDCAAK
jgi:ATP-dependent DNA helicase RecG